jgi:hypothetical protein
MASLEARRGRFGFYSSEKTLIALNHRGGAPPGAAFIAPEWRGNSQYGKIKGNVLVQPLNPGRIYESENW